MIQSFEKMRLPAITPAAVTAAYLSAVFFVVPLVMHNGYFDVVETKQVCFLALTALYLGAIILLAAIRVFQTNALPPMAALIKRLTLCDAAMLAFLAAYTVSALLDAHTIDALYAPHARYQGLFSVFCYAAAFFCVSKCVRSLTAPALALCAGLFFSGILAFVNHFGLDPLGIVSRLGPLDRGRYVSTLGNVNFFAAYVSLAFPAALAFLCLSERPLARTFSALGVIGGALALSVSVSESAALGFFSALAILPLALRKNRGALVRFFAAAACIFLLLIPIGLVSARVASEYPISFFVRTLSRVYLALPLALVCAAASLFCSKSGERSIRRMTRLYPLFWLLVFVLAIAALVLINTVFREADLGTLSRFVRFGAEWGTSRGRIWTRCVTLYASFDPLRRVFGGGVACLYYADLIRPVFTDATVDAAHNEYLQYLLAAGAVGLISYLSLLTSAFSRAFRRTEPDGFRAGFLAGAFACAVQAVVNIAQPASTPILFLFLALY